MGLTDRKAHLRRAAFTTNALRPEAARTGPPLRRSLGGVVLLTFSHHPRELNDALLGSVAACSAADRGVHTQPVWANGAKVFVDGLWPELLAAAGVAHL